MTEKMQSKVNESIVVVRKKIQCLNCAAFVLPVLFVLLCVTKSKWNVDSDWKRTRTSVKEREIEGKEGEVDEKGRLIVESNININLDVIYIPQITKHISQIFYMRSEKE